MKIAFETSQHLLIQRIKKKVQEKCSNTIITRKTKKTNKSSTERFVKGIYPIYLKHYDYPKQNHLKKVTKNLLHWSSISKTLEHR